MKRDCLNCGQKEMVHTVRDVPYTYKGHDTVIPMVKGWHCFHCGVRNLWGQAFLIVVI